MAAISWHLSLIHIFLKGKVLIIGAGGLGAPAAMYLAAAGVGTIGIVDADEVDPVSYTHLSVKKGDLKEE